MTAAWVRVDLDLVEKYGADAAVLHGLFVFRANGTGEWTATLTEIHEQSRLTLHRVRSAIQTLKDAGMVSSGRADRFRPTLTWTVFAGHAVNGETLITRSGESDSREPQIPHSPESGESAFSSLENVKKKETPTLRVVADEKPAPRPEVVALCEQLADRVEGNGSKRPRITQGWLDSCRLLLDRDARTPEQVAKAIDWCQADEFWRVNVLSMPTLRKQYDRLRLAAQRAQPGTAPVRTPTPAPSHYLRPDQLDVAPPSPDASPEEYREWYRQQAARNAQ